MWIWGGSLPVDEGPLGVHQVELVVEPGPGLAHCGRVGQGTHRPLHLYREGLGLNHTVEEG